MECWNNNKECTIVVVWNHKKEVLAKFMGDFSEMKKFMNEAKKRWSKDEIYFHKI